MKVERYWSRFADDFDARQAYAAGRETVEAIRKKLSEQQSLGTVIEFGCGNGGYTRAIINQAESITATDDSVQMVEKARGVFAHADTVVVEKADCRQTDFQDESFDTVLMANLIHVIGSPEKAVSESWRILRPGGKLIVTCFTVEGMKLLNKIGLLIRYWKTFGALPKERTPFSRATLGGLLKKEGFLVEESVLLGDRTHALFVRCRKAAAAKPAGRTAGQPRAPSGHSLPSAGISRSLLSGARCSGPRRKRSDPPNRSI